MVSPNIVTLYPQQMQHQRKYNEMLAGGRALIDNDDDVCTDDGSSFLPDTRGSKMLEIRKGSH